LPASLGSDALKVQYVGAPSGRKSTTTPLRRQIQLAVKDRPFELANNPLLSPEHLHTVVCIDRAAERSEPHGPPTHREARHFPGRDAEPPPPVSKGTAVPAYVPLRSVGAEAVGAAGCPLCGGVARPPGGPAGGLKIGVCPAALLSVTEGGPSEQPASARHPTTARNKFRRDRTFALLTTLASACHRSSKSGAKVNRLMLPTWTGHASTVKPGSRRSADGTDSRSALQPDVRGHRASSW
jgi:hypothetical protein